VTADEFFRDLPDPPPFRFAYMPRGPEWLSDPPTRIKDGQAGVDFRLVRDLARMGYKTYYLDPLRYLYKTMPAAVPVFTDWINYIDERLPEPRRTKAERKHKDSIWMCLNINLIDPAAKGDRETIEALFGQFDKSWAPEGVRYEAARALDYIATKADNDRMVALLRDSNSGVRNAVTHYLGRFRTDRSHDLLVHRLATDPEVTQAAMTALARMKRPEDIEILRPWLDDPRDLIQRDAKRAIAKLEKATAK